MMLGAFTININKEAFRALQTNKLAASQRDGRAELVNIDRARWENLAGKTSCRSLFTDLGRESRDWPIKWNLKSGGFGAMPRPLPNDVSNVLLAGGAAQKFDADS